MHEAGPTGLDPLVGIEKFLLAARLYAETNNIERGHGLSFHKGHGGGMITTSLSTHCAESSPWA
jgi:hypothetical protein